MRAKDGFLLPREKSSPLKTPHGLLLVFFGLDLGHMLTARPITAKGKDQFLSHDQS